MMTTPMTHIRPQALKKGNTLGIFTPSSPSYLHNEELFQNGIENLKRLGFKIKLGTLTSRRGNQGYRSGTPKERADEFMELILDPEIHGLISTIGGMNSNSIIPHLDFNAIRNHPKVICGYSDVTSLHLAILAYSGLRTFYGPALMTWFGEFPHGIDETTNSFLEATTLHRQGVRGLKAPQRWSNHRRRWDNGDWKNFPREWNPNLGWKTLLPGTAQAPLIAANLNTLVSAAGTPYFPDLSDKILLIESMDAPFSGEERRLRQLQLMGVFDRIAGLIIGKPENPNLEGAPFTYDELIAEIVGCDRAYPVVTEFDCSHTVPMLTLAQLTPIRLHAQAGRPAEVEILEPMVQ